MAIPPAMQRLAIRTTPSQMTAILAVYFGVVIEALHLLLPAAGDLLQNLPDTGQRVSNNCWGQHSSASASTVWLV